MKYTENEKRMILDHLEKIKAYLLELAPRLGDRYEVKFYSEKSSTPHYVTLCNYGSTPSISGWIGRNLDVSWDRPKSPMDRTIYDLDRDSTKEYCTAILKNWQYIKASINEEIERQEATREMIANFEI